MANHLRLAARVGAVAALLNLVVAPFHGAAYFGTEDGGKDLMPHQRAWGAALRDAIPGAFGDDPYAAYLAWGKATALAVALFAAAFALLHRAQRDALTPRAAKLGVAAVALWIVFGSLALGGYFTPYTDQLFLLMVPTLLAVLLVTGFYARATRRAGVVPRAFAAALFAAPIVFIPLVIVAGHIPFGLWGFSTAWLVLAGSR